MAGTIKGITIEIDGNTSGLQEALKDVNKNINGLGSELRQVDGLLKLDPTNTTILAQKQELLKKAIAETSDKLKILKDSQEQVETAFKNGDIGEEQYRAFEREVAKAENQLNSFTNQLKSADNETEDLSSETKRLENAQESAGKQTSRFGDILKANLTAGAILGGVSSIINAIGSITSKVAEFSKETIQHLDEMIKTSGEYADEIITLANVTNLDAGTLQGWGYASRFIDTEVDTIAKSIAKMTKSLNTNEATYQSLGVTLKNTNGTYRTQQEIFLDTIDALGKIDDETQRDAISMQLFGKSAQELNPLIKAGGEELAKMSEEAEKLGLILSDEQLTDLGAFDDMMQELEAISISFGQHIALAFLPIAEAIYNPFKEGFGEINKILSDGIQEGDLEAIKLSVLTNFDAMATSIREKLPAMREDISTGLKLALDVLADILPDLLSLGGDIISTLKDGLSDAMADPQTQADVNSIMSSLASAFSKAIEELESVFGAIAEQIVDSILAGFENIDWSYVGKKAVEWIVKVNDIGLNKLNPFNKWLQRFAEDDDGAVVFEQTGNKWGAGLVTGINNGTQPLDTKGGEMVANVSNGLFSNAGLVDTGTAQVTSQINGGIDRGTLALSGHGSSAIGRLRDGMSSNSGAPVGEATRIANMINGGLASGTSGTGSIGSNIVQGISNGITNGTGWIFSRITEWAGSVINYIKKVFKINSPSKLMSDEVGLMMSYGVGDGILAGLPRIQQAMGYITDKVATSVNPIINPSLALAGAGNSTTVNPVINITVQGNADKPTIDYLMDQLNKKMGGLI